MTTESDAYLEFIEIEDTHRLGCPWCRQKLACTDLDRIVRLIDAASIALDTATAEAISGADTPGSGPTWSQRWRTRQAAIWSDREHKALMAEVAW